ncbi:MAG: hypothetical protein EXR79_00805 [Myxococcales bacterium]|nr:hypothetical protein [Myxococcales bacterium]
MTLPALPVRDSWARLACCCVPVLALCLAVPAVATPPNAALLCPADAPVMTAAQHLRAVSLDVRGTLPVLAEFEALPGAAKATPEATLDAWLATPAFAEQAVRRHRDLLWPNLSGVAGRLVPTAVNISQEGAVWHRPQLAPQFRGLKVPCNSEPAEFTPQGQIIFEPMPDGSKREGYVLVSPYWAPNTQIKVCAQDAQDDVVSPNGTDCGAAGALADLGCGCGPNLRYCMGAGSQAMIANSFVASMERQILQLFLDDRPYLDLFTESVMWVNGPIVHYFRYHATNPGNVRLVPYAFDLAALPDLQFPDKEKWIKVQLPPHHAGILTSPAFLLRFQTLRARANRFYNSFLCQPFQAPASGIPVAGVAAISEPDLQKRDGCKYCHALLEPAASFWGRWTQSGAGYLGSVAYPPTRADCVACALTGIACSADCTRFYLTKAYAPPEKPFLGWLHAYNYRQPEHVKYIEQGPKLLAMMTAADHRLPRCVARSTAEWLLGRDLDGDELAWADQLAVSFVAQKYSWRKLVKAVVQSDVYRRAQ